MNQPISRRNFLRKANCAAISSLPVLNTLLNLRLAGGVAAAAAPAAAEHRALVCLFLSGGIDTFNVLVPRGASEYAEYKTSRGGIALPQESLLPISPTGLSGLQLGLHPALTGVKSLLDAGKGAFVANVGTLLEPTTKDSYDNDGKLPLNLYSHSDQIEQWHTGILSSHSPKGWGGRTADILKQLNSIDTVSMNISLTGSNIWQSGETVFEYTVSTDGAIALSDYDPTSDSPYLTKPIRTKAVDSQLAFTYQHLLQEAFAAKKRGAMDAYKTFNEATVNAAIDAFAFPDTYLGRQFRMIAKAVAGHTALGQSRQTFFVEYGGWDHHDGLIAGQAEMLPEVDGALKAFFDCLASLQMENNVTVFTASDFSRTLTTDSDGADHAWGGNHLILGGAVNGNKIYGSYPSLAIDGPLDVGRGRLIPQVAVDSYFAELALWLGVSKSDLPAVLPNIGTFYSTGSSTPPLGFMKA